MHKTYMPDYRQGSLDYLRFVLDQTGLTPSALAAKAGLSSTTLTRPLNDKGHKFTLSTSTLARIKDATGFDAGPFLTRDMDALARTLDTWNNPAEYSEDYRSGATIEQEWFTPIIGEVAAGNWLEHRFVPDDALGGLQLVHPRDAQRQFFMGLYVRGESLNKLARDGDILFTEVIANTGAEWDNGDLVVVERTSAQGGLFEMSAKRVRVTKRRIELIPESTHPDFQEPLELGDSESQTVRVVGIVRYIIRLP